MYLFTIGRDGTVSPVGDAAADLAEAGVHDPDPVPAVTARQIVEEYLQGVLDRIGAATAAIAEAREPHDHRAQIRHNRARVTAEDAGSRRKAFPQLRSHLDGSARGRDAGALTSSGSG
ncbi:hypothetical protein [Micromonospora sp. RTP1Z1]|uniref:hypothetical protein n=1 Tax=Micromonospora sp. RTP1Z1 TaxID=2994043 RepID=UPI0029C63174|nr:hypothetical protein [Micromonospora sp. RTP1Z1]